MVCSRLVNCPDSPEGQQLRPIPEMMFAVGEEPIGVRVLTYLSSRAIKRIFTALDEEEVQMISRSSFGKIVDIADKPVFSGRFARYILSRQLKTKKKHEAWFRFAGNPIRFSLREFAIVTGLPCGKFPTKSRLKLKETITEKPYWPALFGKVDVMTVSSVVKMLRRRTVKERVVRIKYACLAILSSVLLPTNTKMKISREHVEAIEDIDDFFAYPWGRLAFDMLMSSIKERDEVALSQNNIAVKGFALALQLVMVEAVPSLREVVQETCSSSEGDSEEDVDDMIDKHKKQTLSPGHARNVDKQINVFVRSIIDQDPDRPIDESNLGWSDEEEDEKVDNLVTLIKTNHQFNNSLFIGGVTKLEVEKMRESAMVTSNMKKAKKPASTPYFNDPGYIVSLILEKMKPEFEMLDGKITQACTKVDLIEGSIDALLHSVFLKFKDQIVESVRTLLTEFGKDVPRAPCRISEIPIITGNGGCGNAVIRSPIRDGNDITIRNILGNLSEYSTPPRSTRGSEAKHPSSANRKADLFGDGEVDPFNQSCAVSAQSQIQKTQIELNQEVDRRVMDNTDMPSFSLGLTQEFHVEVNRDKKPTEVVHVSPEDDVNVDDNIEDHQVARKSKRQKCVPQALLADYQCGPHLLSRVRQSEKFIFLVYHIDEFHRKYGKLSKKLTPDLCINLGGLTISGKDIQLITERSHLLSAKVVDILIHLLKSALEKQIRELGKETILFLDTKLVSVIAKTYPKFCKSRKKESFIFPKGLFDLCNLRESSFPLGSRVYFPFNIAKKHWVGICVEQGAGKMIVLDCNSSLFNDESMDKYLTPLVYMLPFLLRWSNKDSGVDKQKRLAIDRPKFVSQNRNPCDSGLMAVLLMGTHAVYGIEACRNISTDMVAVEGKSAAIMAYEFKEKL